MNKSPLSPYNPLRPAVPFGTFYSSAWWSPTPCGLAAALRRPACVWPGPYPQADSFLANNQKAKIRCGDNGIFKGMPLREEDKELSKIAHTIYEKYPYDGKYILDHGKLVICQSHAKKEELRKMYPNAIINPLGEWIGGTNADSGATNRKLGSDMAESVTGGGLHGKDLSKADVAINIYAFVKAQQTGEKVELSCAIGDDKVDGKDYSEIVEIARKYIEDIGGFEKLAEWGLY